MAPIKFFFALSSLAIFSCTFGALPTNALSVDSHHVNRRFAHDSIAKKKRDGQTRCKHRPPSSSSTSITVSSSIVPAYTPKSSVTPTTTTSTYTPPSTPTSNSGNGGGGKLGIAWAMGNDDRLKLLKNDRTKFIYTWSPEIPQLATDLGFVKVPQLWGWSQTGDFGTKVKAGYAQYVLGMNEPNQAGQALMSPEDGAKLWMQYIQPLKAQGYTLITPATTSAPDGLDWMKKFMAACTGCTFDIVALHFYDDTFAKLQTYLELWHNTFGRPIWLTEFACQNFNGGAQPDSGHIWDFYTQAIKYMDATDWVEAYFPFGYMEDMSNVNPALTLFSGNGLSALGWLVTNGPSS